MKEKEILPTYKGGIEDPRGRRDEEGRRIY